MALLRILFIKSHKPMSFFSTFFTIFCAIKVKDCQFIARVNILSTLTQ